MASPEQQLQIACVQYLERCCPPPPVGPAWSAINPVPSKSKAVAGLSKAMGMKAGWPDLQLVHQGKAICIELKAGNGRHSPAQREVHAALTLAGAVVHTIRSLDEFVDFLAMLGIGRGKVAA